MRSILKLSAIWRAFVPIWRRTPEPCAGRILHRASTRSLWAGSNEESNVTWRKAAIKEERDGNNENMHLIFSLFRSSILIVELFLRFHLPERFWPTIIQPEGMRNTFVPKIVEDEPLSSPWTTSNAFSRASVILRMISTIEHKKSRWINFYLTINTFVRWTFMNASTPDWIKNNDYVYGRVWFYVCNLILGISILFQSISLQHIYWNQYCRVSS